MRAGNLAALHLEENLRDVTVGREPRLQIHVPAEQVKSARDLHHELGARSIAVLDIYLELGRPVLLHQPSDYRFPAMDGGAKGSGPLSELIRKTIATHTGLEVNPHLFRSIPAKIHDRVKPGDWGTTSHVLHHTLGTTLRSYVNFERDRSIRLYHDSLEQTRDELGLSPGRRSISRRAS